MLQGVPFWGHWLCRPMSTVSPSSKGRFQETTMFSTMGRNGLFQVVSLNFQVPKPSVSAAIHLWLEQRELQLSLCPRASHFAMRMGPMHLEISAFSCSRVFRCTFFPGKKKTGGWSTPQFMAILKGTLKSIGLWSIFWVCFQTKLSFNGREARPNKALTKLQRMPQVLCQKPSSFWKNRWSCSEPQTNKPWYDSMVIVAIRNFPWIEVSSW